MHQLNRTHIAFGPNDMKKLIKFKSWPEQTIKYHTKIRRSYEKKPILQRERKSNIPGEQWAKILRLPLGFGWGPLNSIQKTKWEIKKAKKKQKKKKKGYHEMEHRVCKSASHSEQSCRNSNFQRPPLPFETVSVFVRMSERERGVGSWEAETPSHLCLYMTLPTISLPLLSASKFG